MQLETVNDVLTEKEILTKILEYADERGWSVDHVFEASVYARRTTLGFPDLVMIRAGKMLVAELKSQKGTVSMNQRHWLRELAEVAEIAVYLWRPSDWPEILEVLT